MNTQVIGNSDNAEYDAFLARMNERFTVNTNYGKEPLFTTDSSGLFEAYLAAFPQEQRQYHTCHCCRTFIERFGGLVTINEEGRASSAIWNEDDASDFYKPAIAAMSKIVGRAKITGVFMSSEREWGSHETGVWHHLSVTPAASMVFKRSTQTAGQAMAEKREDYKTVMRALSEFTQPNIGQALTLLKTESLYRSEKVLGQAEWLHELHVARDKSKGSAKSNVIWRAVAMAPAGFCHPRSSMIGTLLEDIASGMEFSEVSRRFADKMHPLQYQRPQAAPSSGAIAAAEKVIAQLGAAGSLNRRFARLEDVQALWTPTPEKQEHSTGGVFGHLTPKGASKPMNMSIPAQVMTWDKFSRTILPDAEKIEFMTPIVGPYTSLVTAANPDSPPILQWDSEEKRNPVSWYFWHGGSTAESFGLPARSFVKVNAVALKPSMWNGGNEHHGSAVLFVLDGAADTRMPGAALFPEILKSEFHGVRSVLEAYSRNAEIEGKNQQSAAGVMLTKGEAWNATVRVWTDGRSVDYKLDRWD